MDTAHSYILGDLPRRLAYPRHLRDPGAAARERLSTLRSAAAARLCGGHLRAGSLPDPYGRCPIAGHRGPVPSLCLALRGPPARPEPPFPRPRRVCCLHHHAYGAGGVYGVQPQHGEYDPRPVHARSGTSGGDRPEPDRAHPADLWPHVLVFPVRAPPRPARAEPADRAADARPDPPRPLPAAVPDQRHLTLLHRERATTRDAGV